MANQKKFASLCRDPPRKGYALDFDFEVIDEADPYKDTDYVCQKIKDCIEDIEKGTDREIQNFWIRKTYARSKQGKKFDLEVSSTWKEENFNRYYSRYKRKNSIDGMVVIAAIDGKVETEDDFNGEEYTLSLKKDVVEELQKRNKKIKGTTGRGSIDKGKSPGYILYLTYRLK